MSASPISFSDDLVTAVGGPGIGMSPGQCPMITSGPQAGSCAVVGTSASVNSVGGATSCALYRECDAYTGAQHVEYTLPSGVVGNANVWSVGSGGKLVWLGPDGKPTTPPNWATPPTLGVGNSFVSSTNPAAVQKLQSLQLSGYNYNPSSGWTPAANSVPTATAPSGGSAFVKPNAVTPNNPSGSVSGVMPTGVIGSPSAGGTAGQGSGTPASQPTAVGTAANAPASMAASGPSIILIGAVLLLAVFLIK
jgi:hypothetical protein